jgi:hemolysin activation/secretion protein
MQSRLKARFLVLLAVASLLATAPASAQSPPAAIRFDIVRFNVEGNTLLAASDIEKLLAPFTGKDRDFGDVQRALESLQAAYDRRGLNLVSVALPEQELNKGAVRLVVTQARLGKITVEGNRFHDAANIRASLPALQEGTTPDLTRVSASLRVANENSSKQTTLNLQRGSRDGEVDAILRVADDKPWKVGLTVDNSGSESTGETNVGAFFEHANFGGLDHVLGLQYSTTMENPDKVSVYGAGYHIPFYRLGDSLDIYANHSDADSGTVFAGLFDLQVRGKGTAYGTRYNHELPRAGSIQSKLVAGLDYRDYRNDVTLQGIPLGNDITLRPVSLAYLGTWKADAAEASLILAAVHNIPGGERGQQDDFDRLRSNADAHYTMLRYGATYARELFAGWQLRAGVNGQYTRDSLVPTEQFGAGGVGSVRGFSVREIANDKGIATTVELQTPELCARVGFAAASCRLLAFHDSARVTRNRALPGESDRASIGSIGLGLRAGIGRTLTAQLDYGHVIDAGFTEMKGDDKLHFRLSWSY